MDSRTEPISRTYVTAAIYAAGALAYWLAVGVGGLTFGSTPLFLGCIMLVASIMRPRLLASAVLLLAWGMGVILLQEGVLPRQRAAAVFLIAFGLAALILLVLRSRLDLRVSLESAAVVMLTGGLALYISYDLDPFGRGWLWAAALLLNAVGLVVAAHWRQRQSSPTTGSASMPVPPVTGR